LHLHAFSRQLTAAEHTHHLPGEMGTHVSTGHRPCRRAVDCQAGRRRLQADGLGLVGKYVIARHEFVSQAEECGGAGSTAAVLVRTGTHQICRDEYFSVLFHSPSRTHGFRVRSTRCALDIAMIEWHNLYAQLFLLRVIGPLSTQQEQDEENHKQGHRHSNPNSDVHLV
jgi:hypothetical protein